jgi:hypothetical protein
MQMEGLWRANLAESTDEALADEISSLLSVSPVIGWRMSPQAMVPVPDVRPARARSPVGPQRRCHCRQRPAPLPRGHQ